MSFHSKSLYSGVLIAFILSIGMTTSVLAQPPPSNTDSEPVQLDLHDAMCTVNIRHEDGDFGEWEWHSGTGWMRTSTDSGMELWILLLADTYSGCDLRVTFGGLSDGDRSIPASNFSAAFGSVPQEPVDFTVQGLRSVDNHVFYTLVSIPESIPPGTYTGEVVVSVTNAA